MTNIEESPPPAGYAFVAPSKDLIQHHTVFFTITLNPKWYGTSFRTQIRKTLKPLYDLLDRHCDSFLIVSEATKQCNAHYHGTLVFKPLIYGGNDIAQLHFLDEYKKFRSTFGFYKIEKIQSLDNVFEYITKDIRTTHYWVNSNKARHPTEIWKYKAKPFQPYDDIDSDDYLLDSPDKYIAQYIFGDCQTK